MFLTKVHNQKVELMRAVFRNMYLKEKCEYLDGECKMLAEQVLSTQVTKEEKTEIKLALEKELTNLRELHDKQMQEFEVVNEQVVSMSKVWENTKSSIITSLDQNESITDELEVKNEMIVCLQAALVRYRLEAAEQWAFIRELRQIKDELAREKELLTKAKPETIARLQGELIQAKLLQTQYSVEFDKIKKELEVIKVQLNKHVTEDNATNERKEGHVKLSLKSVIWKSNNNKKDVESNKVEAEIQKLEHEKSYLQTRIPELQNKIAILDKHIQFKEAERAKLQEKIDSIKLKQKSIESITLERSRQYDLLRNSASEKVCVIRNNTVEKAQNIDELSHKLGRVSMRRESTTNREVLLRESKTIQNLEDKIFILGKRLEVLKSEMKQLHPKKAEKNRPT